MVRLIRKIPLRLLLSMFLLPLLNACGFFPLLSPTPMISIGTPDGGYLIPTLTPQASPAAKATRPAAPSATSLPPQPPQLLELNKRAGFGMSTPADVKTWATRLGAGWYLDWTVKDIEPGATPERWQLVSIRIHAGTWTSSPSMDQIAKIAQKDPGSVWVIGNEPDVIWQDSLPPEIYAQAYHDLYALLKQADRTAQVATAGISEATPLRLAYLDRVLAEYRQRYGSPLPADWWTVHGFVLREEKGSWGVDIPPGFTQTTGKLYEVEDHGRFDLFSGQLEEFRKWMAANGYRNTPLALTEFGILMSEDLGYPPETTAAYLKQTFTWLATANDGQVGYPADQNRLVQRWAWFSLSDHLYPASNLADLTTDQLTTIGQAYFEFTLGQSAAQTK